LLVSSLYIFFCRLLVLMVLLARGDRGMEIEVLVPRHELSILRRQVGQPRFEPHDRLVNVDEVYRTFTDPSFGWPWAWVRVIDVADPAHATIVGEYKISQQTEAFKAQEDPATEAFTS
jgi:hypothetical protein